MNKKLVTNSIELQLDSQRDDEKPLPKGDNLTEIKKPPRKPSIYSMSEQKYTAPKVLAIDSIDSEDERISYVEIAQPQSEGIKAESFISQKAGKISIKIKPERGPAAELLEGIKSRKYSKEYFEKQRKEQIGLSTLVGPRRETSIIKLVGPGETGGMAHFERQQSLDSSEHIPNMDILLNTIDKNTSLKIKLEKAIIEFNQSPTKAFEFLWKEQIVSF